MTAAATLEGEQLLARFNALDGFLLEHWALWHPRPFIHAHMPWEQQHPELALWLRSRTVADADEAQKNPHTLAAPAPYPALAAEAARLAAIGELSTSDLQPAPARLNVDVPGRKWQQIEAFGSRMAFTHVPHHWLDWCAGKGHLGRRLLAPGQSLTCLERDPTLVAAGKKLSQHHGLATTYIQQDVMAVDASRQLTVKHTPIALHACGDLHVRLIQLASAAGCTQLAIAPCCYNRTTHTHYQPLSRPAQTSCLTLDLHDLALPATEAVTAGRRARRQRDQSMARRLAFDLLQRRLRGIDDYLPTPSLPSQWLDKPFADYCHHLAQLKGLPPPGTQDWPALEQTGYTRLAEVRNLELIRNIFRRPLELWLALDRALMLQENGYTAELGTFCPYALTPRNLMIRAERQPVDNSVGNNLA